MPRSERARLIDLARRGVVCVFLRSKMKGDRC